MEQGKKTRRVLLIGGSLDGKWREQPKDAGPYIRVLKPAKIEIPKVVSREAALAEEIRVPVPEYEVYYLDKIALYGEGIWVGIEQDHLRNADRDHFMGPEPRVAMILRAILQRDVLTEMGL